MFSGFIIFLKSFESFILIFFEWSKFSSKKNSAFDTKSEIFFYENSNHSKKINIKDLKDFKKIMNPENISRKECLLLPFKTLSKALN